MYSTGREGGAAKPKGCIAPLGASWVSARSVPRRASYDGPWDGRDGRLDAIGWLSSHPFGCTVSCS